MLQETGEAVGVIPYNRAMYQFSMSYAYASTGQCEDAVGAADKFNTLADDEDLRATEIWPVTAGDLLDLADQFLQARLGKMGCVNNHPPSLSEVSFREPEAVIKRNDSLAVSLLAKAVNVQDSFPYMEPPVWPWSTRICLGQALLDDGRYTDAEMVYHEHLKRWPKSGWGLKGLQLALEGQKTRSDEALRTAAQFKAVWKDADVELLQPCF